MKQVVLIIIIIMAIKGEIHRCRSGGLGTTAIAPTSWNIDTAYSFDTLNAAIINAIVDDGDTVLLYKGLYETGETYSWLDYDATPAGPIWMIGVSDTLTFVKSTKEDTTTMPKIVGDFKVTTGDYYLLDGLFMRGTTDGMLSLANYSTVSNSYFILNSASPNYQVNVIEGAGAPVSVLGCNVFSNASGLSLGQHISVMYNYIEAIMVGILTANGVIRGNVVNGSWKAIRCGGYHLTEVDNNTIVHCDTAISCRGTAGLIISSNNVADTVGLWIYGETANYKQYKGLNNHIMTTSTAINIDFDQAEEDTTTGDILIDPTTFRPTAGSPIITGAFEAAP